MSTINIQKNYFHDSKILQSRGKSLTIDHISSISYGAVTKGLKEEHLMSDSSQKLDTSSFFFMYF